MISHELVQHQNLLSFHRLCTVVVIATDVEETQHKINQLKSNSTELLTELSAVMWTADVIRQEINIAIVTRVYKAMQFICSASYNN